MHATAINRSSKRNTQCRKPLGLANGPECRAISMGEVRVVSPQAEARP